MPRRPRDSAPGIHHVWVNATGDWDYFLDEVDRIMWVRLLVMTVRAHGWTCIAFCQMSTHVHLLVDVPDNSLSIGMRELNREYSCAFNLRHGRVGTFVRKRYGSRRIKDGDDLLGTYAYVVLNPVADGLCRWPHEWYWSSYRTTVAMLSDFPFVDAAVVIAEACGVAQLRKTVEGIAQTHHKRTRRNQVPTCP